MLYAESMRLDQGTGWYEEEGGSGGSGKLVIATYGKCLYWIDGGKQLLEKGDFLYIPAGVPYYGKCIPTVFHEKYVLSIVCAPDAPAHIPLLGSKRFVKSSPGVYELCLEKVRGACKEWQERLPYAQVRAAAAAMEVLALWSRELDRGREASVFRIHADKMKAYIAAHYREKVTKEELGACIGRSPNHAAYLFRKMTGQTISEYVHAARMRTAAYQLTESLLTVAEIAEYLGYSDVSYFQRVFKRTFGVPPSHYLKDRPGHV